MYYDKNKAKKYKKKSNKRHYKEEKKIIDQPEPANQEQMEEIGKQMKKSVCKIICKNHSGTGFFCFLNFQKKSDLPVLFTNYHILREKEILHKKIINISLDDDKISYKIVINENTKTYIDEVHDTTIIEIKDKNIIENVKFLSIDKDVYNFNYKQIDKYIKKTIYLLQYPDGEKCKNSFGVIKNITLNNYDLTYNCQTADGSSGGPIILLDNNKIIGIHKGALEQEENNVGTFIIKPIEGFIQKYNKNKINMNMNKNINDNMNKNINNKIANSDIKINIKNNSEFVTIKEDIKNNNRNNNQYYDEITIIYKKKLDKSYVRIF